MPAVDPVTSAVGMGSSLGDARPTSAAVPAPPCQAATGVRQAGAMERRPVLARRLHGLGTTIFAEMSALAVSTGSVNLGQGFPDTDGPAEVAEAAIAAIRSGENQYPPGPGIAPLREAIAEHQARCYGLVVGPGDRGARHDRGDGGDRRGDARARRARRRGGRARAVLRLLRRLGCDGRRPAGAGDARAPGVQPGCLGAARRGHRPDAAVADQHAAQPDRRGAVGATSCAPWPRSPSSATCWS